MVFFNNAILPETNHMLKNLMIKANYRRPVTAIIPGTFTTLKKYTIYVKERVDEELNGILIYSRESTKFPQTISAECGNVFLSNGGNSLKAVLYNGQMHERNSSEPEKYQVSQFKKFTLNLPDLGYKMNEASSDYRGDRELSSRAMLNIISGKKEEIIILNESTEKLLSKMEKLKEDTLSIIHKKDLKKNTNNLKIKKDKIKTLEADIRKYEVEVHKKYAIAFACLIFVLIGAPVGMMTKTTGVGMAFSVSAFVFLIYYGCLTFGEELADKGVISPFLAMWIANIIFSIIGVYLVVISVKEMKITWIEMRILDKYLLKEYIKTFLIIIFAFSVLFFVVDVSDRLPRLLRKGAPLDTMMIYFLLRIPYLIILTSPVMVLLSGLFLMNNLSKYNESVAIRGAGISIVRMVTPLLWFGFIFSILILIFGEFVLPKAEEFRQHVYTEKIKNMKVEDKKMRSHIHYLGKDNNLYYIGFFDGYRNHLKTIDITTFHSQTGELERKITAINAVWEEDHWDFMNCYIRTFKKGKLSEMKYYDSTVIDEVDVTPIDFIKTEKSR
jgi:lipopolysaccharide export LptBFGC system permease protein LptF